MNRTFKSVIIGIFIAQSLVLYLIEGLLPVPFIAPGAKLGLSNLITVIALYTFPRKRDTAYILLGRIILSTAFAGGINAFLYSIAGAVFSFAAMTFLKKTNRFTLIGVSAAGGILHNWGQMAIACLIVENAKVLLYLPLLSVAGAGTGILIGITAHFTLNRLKRLPVYARMKNARA